MICNKLLKSPAYFLLAGSLCLLVSHFFFIEKKSIKRNYQSELKPTEVETKQQRDKDKPITKSCKWEEHLLVGPLFVDKSAASLEKIKSEIFISDVKEGGNWRPTDCIPRTKVAIIVPFRNREHHLPILLRQLHPILQRQKLEYQIFIVDQADDYPFNRAKLFNAGFQEALKYKDFECFVFHDVDLIPESDKNDYGCPESPRHMCPAVDKFNYQLFSPNLFGGVTSFTKDHFQLVNGYANRYWGWGAEDDDSLKRVRAKGLKLTRPVMEVGRYTMLGHGQGDRNGLAITLLAKGEENMKIDGLNTLKYKVLNKKTFDLYTKISVDLEMTAEEKNITTVKQKQRT